MTLTNRLGVIAPGSGEAWADDGVGHGAVLLGQVVADEQAEVQGAGVGPAAEHPPAQGVVVGGRAHTGVVHS